ncbi:MAG: response regulator [Anaerolineales bacterium]|nr:response regulator [Anaerolineales bacterium]
MTDRQEDKIRLLIVDDHAETRDNIRKILQFEPDIVVVGSARTGQEAIQQAIETQPDVILMDINMPDMDGIKATELILEEVSFAQIVILSIQSEADYMRKAMLAGARYFLAKPPSGDELITTIRTVSERAKDQRKKLSAPAAEVPAQKGDGRQRPMGKLLAVYSPKGGVGCTTLATNMAIGLNSDETPTVLVDGNLQFGDVSVFLNLQVKNSLVDLATRTEELEEDIASEVLMRHDSGLYVLAAPPRPEMADEVQASQVRLVLRFLRQHFAYVVVDNSSTMDDITLAVLDLADVLLAIATTDIPSIKDARLLFDLLSVLEFPKENILFVLNKTDRRSGITAEAVAENLKQAVEGEIPLDDRTVATSVNRGEPLLLGDRSRPIAKHLLDLLATVKQRLMAEELHDESVGETERLKVFGR